MSLLAGGTTHKPIIGAFGLTGSRDVLAGLGFEVAAVVPVDGNVADKLKGVHVFLIVFYHVGSHLQRTVHRDVQGKLAGEG